MMLRALQYLWLTPWTIVSSLALLAYGARSCAWREGFLLVRVERVIPSRFRAQTLGWVVASTREELPADVEAHELTHVRQGLRWGPLFPFRYWGEMLWLKLNGRDPYKDHSLEREARGGPP